MQQALGTQQVRHQSEARARAEGERLQLLQQMQQAVGTQQVQQHQNISHILSAFNAESLNTMSKTVRAKEQSAQDADM
jgi:hypothetical protein